MRFVPVLLAALSLGCFSKPGFTARDGGGDAIDGQPDGPGIDAPYPTRYKPWEVPMALPIGDVNGDFAPTISTNPLELFFVSSRTGQNRLYRATRSSEQSAWGNVMRVTNDSDSENDPQITPSGLDLYYFGSGGMLHLHRDTWQDPWVSDPTIDLPAVGPFDFNGDATRIVAGSTVNPTSLGSDIIELYRNGASWETVSSLNLPSPSTADTAPTIRHDGLEIYYEYNAAGAYETFLATRTVVGDPFTGAAMFQLGGQVIGDPELSPDGTDLYYETNTPLRIHVVHRDPDP